MTPKLYFGALQTECINVFCEANEPEKVCMSLYSKLVFPQT